MYKTGGKPVKGHAVQGLSVDETLPRLRGRAQVRCDAFGIEVWGPAEFEQERGMLEREILAFACPTCGRGLVVDLMPASRMPGDLPRAAEASEGSH